MTAKKIDEYAEMSLEVGRIYFLLSYKDSEFRIPIIETLRYERKGERGATTVAWFENLSDNDVPQTYIEDDALGNLLHDGESLIAALTRNLAGKL